MPFQTLTELWRLALALAFVAGSRTGATGAGIRPAGDAPRPLSPLESLKRFTLAPGFRIELVASEPLLADPVGMAFDERGRLFVCEIYGYNLEGHYDVQELNKTGQWDTQVRRILAPKEILDRAEGESHGSVKLLEDTDGDGRMDRMTAWATNLPPCYGLVPARQGVIVLCAPHIVYLADRDDDGRPEVRETLFTGFGVGEMWTRISNPQWGVDNWICAASGAQSAGTIQGPHLPQPVRLGNTCFRFKPDGSALEPISRSTGGFGLALSDEDDRFLISNHQHALHTLAGLEALNPAVLVVALGDLRGGVRRHALQLSDLWLDRHAALLTRVLTMTNDPDPKVRLQLALTLGETRDARRLSALTALAQRFGDDRWMLAAIVTAMPDAAEALLRESIEPPGPSRSGLRLAALLAGVVGSRGQSSEIARLLHLTAGYAARDAEQLQTACLASLNDALKRGKPPALIDPAGVAALNQLLASSQPAVRRTALQTAGALKLAQSPEVVAVFEQAAQTALDTGRSLSDREAAVVLLGSGPFEVLRKAASVLLMACQPLTLQLAAVSALSQSDDADVAAVLLSDWGSYSPRLQSAVLDALFKRQERIRALLVAVQLNRIPRPGLEPVRQEQLRTNPDPEIRRLAEPWLQRALSSPDRQALLARYQIALSTPRDAVRGKELFQLHSRVTLIHARIGCGPASRLRFRERCGQTLSRQVRSLSKKQTPRISRIARFLGGFRQTARASASIGAVRGYLFGFMG